MDAMLVMLFEVKKIRNRLMVVELQSILVAGWIHRSTRTEPGEDPAVGENEVWVLTQLSGRGTLVGVDRKTLLSKVICYGRQGNALRDGRCLLRGIELGDRPKSASIPKRIQL